MRTLLRYMRIDSINGRHFSRHVCPLGHFTATRARACPPRRVHARVAVPHALPLAPRRTRSPPPHCHSCPGAPPRRVHARVAVPNALPLAPRRTRSPPPHCHSRPGVPPQRYVRRILATRHGRERSSKRIMNMLWLFSFSQTTCHKALPYISACDFCLWAGCCLWLCCTV